MTFTKEEPIQAVYDLKAGYTLGHADITILKGLARMALAGMEAEPVYQMRLLDGSPEENLWVEVTAEEFNLPLKDPSEWDKRILYTAPQPLTTSERAELENYRKAQQVVPDVEPYMHGLWPNAVDALMRYANACRAAMLQGAEPVQEWIPCSERMPDKLIPVMVMYEDGEMWSAMWNGNRWDDGTEYPDPHSVTHWRKMPAAPQQEEPNRIQGERVKIQEEMTMGARLTKHRFKVK